MEVQLRSFVIGIAIVGLLLALNGQPAEAQEKPAGESTRPHPEPDSREIIKVATPEEFLLAVGSNRILHLTADEYAISSVKDRAMDFVRWEKVFDGLSITLRNVRNMSIVGAGQKPARLIVRPAYAFVLHFQDCENIELVNLVLGHAPERGACMNGVLGATSCTGLVVRKCDLFGCGTEGLTLNKVQSLRFEDSIIRDCSYGILSITSCRDLRFERSRFAGNEQYWGMNFNDSRDILFEKCTVENNTADDALLEVTSCSNIRFKEGAIRGNRARSLVARDDAVQFEGTAFEKNEFKQREP